MARPLRIPSSPFWQLLLAGIICSPLQVSAAEDLDVLASWRKYRDAPHALYAQAARQAEVFLDDREQRLRAVETTDDWHQYIADAQQRIAACFGRFPNKTPLNARVTGRFVHHGVLVEKVVFESRPGFWVPACFYKRADLDGQRLPAVLHLIGHSKEGFRAHFGQRYTLQMASKGFAVLMFDPLGQGERKQYLDDHPDKVELEWPTQEHSYTGLQLRPLGMNAAGWHTWDAIRAIDYLVSRPDIDPQRIGAFGGSGGGTLSLYLGALDPRVGVAAPGLCVFNYRRMFQLKGPGDAENTVPNFVARGLDNSDLMLVRAPRPLFVFDGTYNFSSIQGTRESVATAGRAFAALGAAGNIVLAEADVGHSTTPKIRSQRNAFFMKYFGVAGSAHEDEVELPAEELLRVTDRGNVVAAGSKHVHDVIQAAGAPVFAALEESRTRGESHRRTVAIAARQMSGMRDLPDQEDTIFTGRFHRSGYAIERVIVDAPDFLPIPILLFVPPGKEQRPAVVYCDQSGKARDAAEGGLIEQIVQRGFVLASVDLPGCGELAYREIERSGLGAHGEDAVIEGQSLNLLFGIHTVGRSITGLQAEAIQRTVRYVANRNDVDSTRVQVIGRGTTGVALLHATIGTTHVRSIALLQSPCSWRSVVEQRYYRPDIGMTVVYGALTRYDLPDLMALAEADVTLMDPVEANGRPLTAQGRQLLEQAVDSLGGDITIAESSDLTLLPQHVESWLARD